MEQRRSRIAIVDPYAGGANIAPALSRRGYESVVVQSTPEVPELFGRARGSVDASGSEQFTRRIVFDGNVAATADQLAALGVAGVIAGCDMGVELADALSEHLSVPSNGTASSAARRDKAIMGAAVAANGLRTIAQRASSDVELLVVWADAGGRWPVIVKPLRSCASDSVALCHSEAELRAGFARIVGERSVLGEINALALAQEFVAGTEYIVDVVSRDGVHRAAAFWRYDRPAATTDAGRAFVSYDAMILLPYSGAEQRQLFTYACAVLDALGVRHGPSHCEIILDERGPVLVEIGARLSAGDNAVMSAWCGGPCALELTLDAALEPERFKAEAAVVPTLSRTAAHFFLRPALSGTLRALPRVPAVEALASFHSMRVSARIGLPLPRVAGLVTLMHDDRDAVEADLGALRWMASDGFYEIEAVGEGPGLGTDAL